VTAPRDTLVVSAPAKVNLFLHVTGRRDDGYHTLESLLALIDWCDTITLSRRADGDIARGNPVSGVPESEDLALAAARALKAATGAVDGVTIGIEKNIPQGAGLGGGSSDAASVLLALNRLWALGMPRSELAAIGATLGADVPFFIGGESALARGIGELLTPVSLPTLWIALVVPPVEVATKAVFAALQLTPFAASAKIDVFSEGYGRNDLQSVVAARFPAVAGAIDALKRASRSARMTGSGACAFAAFTTEDDAKRALTALPPGCAGRVVRTLARHPLFAFAYPFGTGS
jgi:4-diphosphocytidyl-2-C-methyl-D-erythritol kinase